ncbi:glycosyltransferase family 4 protein [Candidatus Chloroploca sp. M-50]|uniref:Glycosyltransferase family 4 protein n=1 Tax=Candidatus Chloroploca mongolica TaxID=2528176 RepID=A0ABS4DA81_9CHLR|nr:glycosyltransferase family 1 protein [Candidatus Chloroploca mongolica]MBP1466354.1 glycosyltransferase family 4 protein [Candidatus Chloroploca mongolica]
MIIGVDYTAAVWQGAGIGRYTRELIRATVKQATGVQFKLLYAAGGLPPDAPYLAELQSLCVAYPHVRAYSIPLTPRLLTILWQRLHLPLYAEWLIGPMDLLHAPDFVLPPTRTRTLVTVHDLTFLVYPECAEAGLRRYLTRAVPRALRRADLVLVDSQATAGDLERLLGVSGPQVRLLYPGVDPRFRPLPQAELAPVRAALGLPAHFLLFVGTLEPRKNLVRLVEAFAQADLSPAMNLVIAGRRGWLYEEVFAAVERCSVTTRVHFVDFVADETLPAVYNLAEAFVYPSLYEGFGLPVLEALACGVPVVTADGSSLPEVVGDAAVLVNPLSVPSIAEGIQQALQQATLFRRKGPAQAHQFTWQASAQTLLTCYAELGARRRIATG